MLCLDTKGKFHLIEIYYETGQVLGIWTLKITDEIEILIEGVQLLENEKIIKYNLMIVLEVKGIGRVICVFSFDPLVEFNVPCVCVFRHWTIVIENGDDGIDKNLPDIVRIRNE